MSRGTPRPTASRREPSWAVAALAATLSGVVAGGCTGRAGTGETAGRTSPAASEPFRLSYRLRGGVAGFDVSFEVAASGAARYERRRPDPQRVDATLLPGRVDALRRLVHGSGFLDLAPRYPSIRPVADGFEYTIRWVEGEREKEVVAVDGAVLPQAFVLVREAVAALEREVLRPPEPRGSEAGPPRGREAEDQRRDEDR